MTSVPNWSLTRQDDNIGVRSFWRESGPSVPRELAQFVQPKKTKGWWDGSQKLKKEEWYTEVAFTMERGKIKRQGGITGVVYTGVKGITLIFGMANRAHNPKYIMSIKDIDAILNC